MALVVVDAENVRRSLWPNLSRDQLVERSRAWAAREGNELLVVFDGDPPEQAPDLVGGRSADDVIATIANERRDTPLWVVTSDRGLRARIGDRADRIVGGGSFAREL